MSNTPEITTLQKVVEELKTAIQSGDCEQMNVKIQDVLKGAQPVQNLIQVGKVQESDEMISNLKAEIRVATGEILQKCPKTNTNVKTNNVKMNTNTTTNNVKTNNTKTNNVNMNTNNSKPNNVNMNTNTNTTKTNNVTMNTSNTNPNNSSQTGGKRSKPVGKRRKTRKSKSSRKM